MNLLPGLLDHMSPTIAGADKPTMANRTIKALEGAGALASRDSERKAKDYRLPGDGQGRLYVVDKDAPKMEGA